MQAIRRGYWTLLTFALSAVFAGAVPECPVEISPQRAVVRYGDPVTVNCTATQTPRGMGWEAPVGSTGMKADVQSVTWNVSSLTDWTAEPKCYGNFLTEPKQCRKNLNISLYKYPDSVSLSPVDQMVEGRQYQLQCEVQNIAPVQYLTVNWYRGQTLIHSQDFFTNTTRTPVNVSATLLFTPDRVDNGQPFTCEAELNLGPEGPQPPPANQSDPLQITVLYEPEITGCPLSVDLEEHQSLQSSVTCTAEGSPPPETRWVKDGQQIDPSVKLTRTHGGQFTYEATNTQGTDRHTVNVTVQYKPTFVSLNKTHLFASGETVILTCRAEGSPSPQYHWNYSRGPDIKTMTTDSKSEITIAAASVGDGGQYKCIATNSLGQAVKIFTVIVEEQDHTFIFIISIVTAIIILTLLLLLLFYIFHVHQHRRGRYSVIDHHACGGRPHGPMAQNGNAEVNIPLQDLSQANQQANGSTSP